MSDARIFLTDYASYNNGTQFKFGHWVDLSDYFDETELLDYIKEHFAECDEKNPLDSPREEIMITDFEGFPQSLYSESMDFVDLFEYLNSDIDKEVLEAFMACFSEDIKEALENCEENYQGEFNSDEDFAETTAEDIGAVDTNAGWPNTCIDWKWAAKELMYDYCSHDGHYFRRY